MGIPHKKQRHKKSKIRKYITEKLINESNDPLVCRLGEVIKRHQRLRSLFGPKYTTARSLENSLPKNI